MKVEALGEFGLIEHLERAIGASSEDVIRGIGDDAAVFRGAAELYWLATCDAQIEGVHFLSARTSALELGRRIAAVNLSDIAAMGGIPRFALSALRVPTGLDVSWVEGVYAGLREELKLGGALIIGGNTARSDAGFSVDLFLLGQVLPEELLTRDAVKPGDVLCVTGALGGSRAGLFLLDHPNTDVSQDASAACLQRHRTPRARLSAGRVLATSGSVKSCIDISDGLVQDASHLARESGVALRIFADRVPVDPSAQEVARAAEENALRWALEGGEDFELLFTVPRGQAETVAQQCLMETGVPVTAIGEVVEGAAEVVIVGADATAMNTSAGGFDHFGGGRP